MRRTLSAAVLALAAVPFAHADIATFDKYPEGFFAQVITDGNITFTNLDRRIDGDPIPSMLTIEDASQDLAGREGYTANNTLGFGGYSPGPGTGFSRFGSMEIIPATMSNSASLNIYEFGASGGLTITLEALRDGGVVNSVSIPANGFFALHHYHLSISGEDFDRLRLSVGPGTSDVIFAVMDTFEITAGGEPPCAPDWNADDAVNSQDFFDFLADFFESNADFNADKVTNSQDFFDFLTAFFKGC